MPTDLLDQMNIFASLYKVNQHLAKFPSLILFFAKYKIPWIFKWQYCVNDNLLVTRQHFVKWWAGYHQQRIIDIVNNEFLVRIPTPINTAKPIPTETATTSVAKPIDKPTSSKSSKQKSKAKSKPKTSVSKEEIFKVAQALLAQISKNDTDDEDAKTEDDTSSGGDSNESTSATHQLPDYYQDAQDPFA